MREAGLKADALRQRNVTIGGARLEGGRPRNCGCRVRFMDLKGCRVLGVKRKVADAKDDEDFTIAWGQELCDKSCADNGISVRERTWRDQVSRKPVN